MLERDDISYIQKNGKRKAFHVGSNSSCRQHIRGHYTLYKERCAELGLKESHHAIPRDIVKAGVEAKKRKRDGQQTLDGIIQKTSQLTEFSRKGLLKAVAEFIVCDDQVGWIVYAACDWVLEHFTELIRHEQRNIPKLSGCHAPQIDDCGLTLNS
jgi:hypothetical protein